MKKIHKKKSSANRQIARERINKLINAARSVFREDKKLANRYVTLARKISMKYKVRIPPKLKRQFCKHCYSYLMPGVNSRVRLTKGKVVYYCLECKKFYRYLHLKK
jgi:ribonuclease P protein subunit RPR2